MKPRYTGAKKRRIWNRKTPLDDVLEMLEDPENTSKSKINGFRDSEN